MIRFDYQRIIDVGKQTAENDERFLKSNFLPLVVADHVEQPEPSIFVGRKGTGKSALRLHFERNHSKTNCAFNVQPSAKDLSAVFSFFDSAPDWAKSVEAIMALWEVTILINIVRSLCVDDAFDIRSLNLSTVPDGVIADIANGERYGIGRTLDLFRTHFPSQEGTSALAREFRGLLKATLLKRDINYFVLIDSIDDVLHSSTYRENRDKQFFMFFEALITYFRSFANAERNLLSKKVFLKLFVPLDIFDRAVGRNSDQVREYKHVVRWDSKLINDFATSRLMRNLPNHHQRRIEQISDADERSAVIWDAFFPRELPVRTYVEYGLISHTEQTSAALIELTLKRPRDFQQIIKSINDILKEDGLRRPTTEMIRKALERYSSELKTSIQKEYELVFPELPEILSLISGNPPYIPNGNMVDLVGRVVGQSETKIAGAMEALYETCILGAVRGKYTGTSSVTFYYNLPDFSAVANSDYFAIHRSLWHALQVIPHRNASRT